MARAALSENQTAILNIASTVIVAGVNFFAIPIFTRMLDTDGYGVVNVYVAWVQIVAVFIGLKLDGTIGSAKANLKEQEQDSFFSSIIFLSFLSGVVILCVVILLTEQIVQLLSLASPLLYFMVFQSFGAFVISLFSMRFIFKKQAHYNFIVSVAVCLSTTAASVFLIWAMPSGIELYYGRVIGLAVPNALIALALIIIYFLMHPLKVEIHYWRFALPLSLPLVFHGLSQLVLSQAGTIGIQNYYGDSLAGVYGIAVTILSVLSAVYSALNNAFVPFMYDDLAGKTDAAVKRSHFMNYMVLFTGITCAFVMMSPEVLKIMSTESYWSAVSVLPLLAVGQYCVFLYSFPVNYEFYKMKTSSIAFGTFCAAVVNIVAMVALIPQFGIMGAAVASMVAYFALAVFHFCFARFRLGDNNYPARVYLLGLVVVTVVASLYYLLADTVAVRWAIGIIILFCLMARVVKKRAIF